MNKHNRYQPQPPQTPREKLPTVHVVEIPPACPTCGSRERSKFEKQSAPERYQNVVVDGVAMAADIVWAYATCLACSQRYRVRCVTPVE